MAVFRRSPDLFRAATMADTDSESWGLGDPLNPLKVRPFEFGWTADNRVCTKSGARTYNMVYHIASTLSLPSSSGFSSEIETKELVRGKSMQRVIVREVGHSGVAGMRIPQ